MMKKENLKDTLDENIDKAEAKRSLRNWGIGALLLVIITFFFGSWIEGRIDNITYRHDAEMIAVVEKLAPDAVPDVVTGLKSTATEAEVERGKEILTSYSYQGSSERFGVRTFFTFFMIVVIVFRGLKFTQTVRKVFVKKKKISSVMSADAPSITVREAIADVSTTIKDPVDKMNAMTESLLDKQIEESKYENFKQKLQKAVATTNRIIEAFINYTEIEARLGTVNIERINVEKALEEAEEKTFEEKNISVEVKSDRDMCLTTDPAFLKEAVGLVINGCAARSAKGSVIAVHAKKDGDMTRISIMTSERVPIKKMWRIVKRFIKQDGILNTGISAEVLTADAIIRRLGGTLSSADDSEYIIELPDYSES